MSSNPLECRADCLLLVRAQIGLVSLPVKVEEDQITVVGIILLDDSPTAASSFAGNRHAQLAYAACARDDVAKLRIFQQIVLKLYQVIFGQIGCTPLRLEDRGFNKRPPHRCPILQRSCMYRYSILVVHNTAVHVSIGPITEKL